MAQADPPELAAEPGWTPVRPFPFFEARRTFTGDDQEGRIAIRYFRRGSDGALVAKAWFGPNAVGAPDRAHGGGVLTVLDEAMGAAAWVLGHGVMTARMSTVFRTGVPLGRELVVETKVERLTRRMIAVSGRLSDAGGTLYAEATGDYVVLPPAKFQAVFGSRGDPAQP